MNSIFWRALLFCFFWTWQASLRAAAPIPETCSGTLDPTFNYPATIRPTQIIPDGDKLMIAHQQGVLRVHPSGALDTAFQGLTQGDGGSFNPVYAAKKDAAGRWLFAGQFTSFNGLPVDSLVRVNTDGSVDAAFHPASNEATYHALALQADGKIVVGGSFTNIAGLARQSIARLKEDGTADDSFNCDTPLDTVYAIAIQSDGKILVGGSYADGTGSRRYLARLNSDGSIDPAFHPPSFINYDVYGITLLADNKILVNGLFSDWQNPSSPSFLARLLPDGSPDPGFTPKLDGPVKSVALQADGKILIGGIFREPDGFHHHLMARLLPDGRLDQSFESGIQMLNGCGDEEAVYAVALDSKNRVMVGGSFFEVNGIARNGLVRLYNDGERCAGLFGFEADALAVTESDTNLTIRVIRTGDNWGRVSVRVTADAYGSAGSADFVAINTNLVFESGISTQAIAIHILDDRQIEPGESFTLRLSDPAGGAGLRNPAQLTVAIIDDESLGLPGSIDASFNAQIAGGSVTALKVQPDGRILISGQFAEIAGQPRADIARLNANGAADSTFNYTGAVHWPNQIALWGDKIYVNGARDGALALARLNANGSVDSNFVSPAFTVRPGGYTDITALAVQPDGKLIVSGGFSEVNGSAHDGIVRLELDGSVDSTFNGSLDGNQNDTAYSLFVLEDGSILAGGLFTKQAAGPILHFSATGTPLDTFRFPTSLNPYSQTRAIARQPDGKIVVLGSFYQPFGDRFQMFRFNVDGSLDTTYEPPKFFPNDAFALAIQPDGKTFTGSVVRLNPDGSPDPLFFFPNRVNGVYSMALEANGDLLIAGSFLSVNEIPIFGLARLHGGSYAGQGAFEFVSDQLVTEGIPFVKMGVRRAFSSNGPASVRVRTRAGSAKPGEDYGEIDQILNFADGDSSVHEIEIPIIDDSIYQGDLSFTVEMESADLPLGPGLTVALVTILENDAAVRFQYPQLQFVEGQGFAAINIEHVGPVGDATVDVVVLSGTAIDGEDFQRVKTTLSFSATSQQVQAVFIPILDDYLPEPNESFYVRLENPSAGTLVPDAPLEVTVLDNAARIGFDGAIAHATQADGVARLIVRQQRDFPVVSDPAVRLHYEVVASSSPAPSQFIPVSGYLEFYAPTPPQEILLPLLPNNIVGPATEITLRLTVVSGEAIVERSEATVFLDHPEDVFPAGSLDSAFTPPIPEKDISIFALAASPDYVFTGGYVRTPEGQDARLLRYRNDGSFDAAFQMKLSDYPRVIVPLPDGKILVGGSFDVANDRPSKSLIRLHSDGTTDLSFDAQFPTRAIVNDVKVAPDGKIIVAASLSAPGLNQAYLTRLLADGTADPAFTPSASNDPINYAHFDSVALQADGRILVGGSFASINGVLNNSLARFLPSGEPDSTFNLADVSLAMVSQVLVTPDSKILLRGIAYEGDTFLSQIVRLNSSGARDATFNFSKDVDVSVNDLRLDSFGRAYIAGPFSRIGDRVTRNIARLTDGGAPDDAFFPPQNADAPIEYVLPTDRGIYVAGGFNHINGEAHSKLARLWLEAPRPAFGKPLYENGHAGLRFNVTPGAAYVLESSSDFKTWNTVKSGVSATGIEATDLTVGTDTATFYRLR